MTEPDLRPQKALPVLPYPSGSGHAKGSDTSRDRERRQDSTGITALTQNRIRAVLRGAPEGLTWKEIDERAKIFHHGKTSGALTALRRAGEIFWLLKQRDGCHLFVHDVWRNKYPESQIKQDEVKPGATKQEAATAVCVALSSYIGSSGDTERWDALREAHRLWEVAL